MNSLKNKLIIILSLSFIFPLGGIGISGLSNFITYDVEEKAENFELSFKNNGLEQGFNFFIYFDALPLDFTIEYSKEFKYQELNTTIGWGGESETTNPSYAGRMSDYFTIRKDFIDLSIPILAKVALNIGAGFNTHKSILPSIALLKDIYNIDSLGDLYNAAEQDWNENAVYDALEENAIYDSGIHLQCGIQAKVLMLNAFINAKYTFITKSDNNSIDSFPGFTIGLAYGI